MTGIFYFSSTGNSLYIAKSLQKAFGGTLVSLSKYNGDGSEFDKIFLVTPIHSFGMPKIVFDFLPKLDKSKELVVIQNYGGMKGGADYLFYECASKHGLNIKAVYTMKMPENFTLTFTVPKFYMNLTLKKADGRINKIIKMIKQEEFKIPKKCKTKEKTYLKNKQNWHLIGQRFKVNDKCVKCQKCVKICPVGNITFKNGEMVFGDKCVACLSCYHRCPCKAITYKNKKKKFRYTNPNIKEDDFC